jgi:dienelactone hydrolase
VFGENVRIEITTIEALELRVPTIKIIPKSPIGAAVVVHGYGGCKEEQLGLAARVASSGLAAYSIDLRGHGQHPMPLDDRVQDDLEAAIECAREYGKVVAIGHSLGGRLSLMSRADYSMGISPPLDGSYGARTEELLQKLRGYRVRTDDPTRVFDILARLPQWEDRDQFRSMIIYGSRDVPEIVASCDALRENRPNVHRIEGALHSDTYLLERTYDIIGAKLTAWFPRDGPRSS